MKYLEITRTLVIIIEIKIFDFDSPDLTSHHVYSQNLKIKLEVWYIDSIYIRYMRLDNIKKSILNIFVCLFFCLLRLISGTAWPILTGRSLADLHVRSLNCGYKE